MGPSAHCKHVCAVIFGLIDFSENKTMNVRASCTSKLQTFHQTNVLLTSATHTLRPLHYKGLCKYCTCVHSSFD